MSAADAVPGELDPGPGADPGSGPTLDDLGLHVGEAVRFRRPGRARWQPAVVLGVEADGSVGLRDEKGAWRAVPAAHVEVRHVGARGAKLWEPLPERVARTEQLKLL